MCCNAVMMDWWYFCDMFVFILTEKKNKHFFEKKVSKFWNFRKKKFPGNFLKIELFFKKFKFLFSIFIFPLHKQKVSIFDTFTWVGSYPNLSKMRDIYIVGNESIVHIPACHNMLSWRYLDTARDTVFLT